MFPAFLITFREVVEASIIVSTIQGILVRLKQTKGNKTIWMAVSTALLASILLLLVGSVLGLRMQKVYEQNEAYIEGVLMILSAVSITWAVFFLHTYFSRCKVHLIRVIKRSIEIQEQNGLFILVFVAVFREGFEIVLFLTSIFFSTRPQEISLGFFIGLVSGILVSYGIFKTTVRIPLSSALKASSALLILFAAGLLARGVHEFAEVGLIPELVKVTFSLIPQKGVFVGDMLKSLFGITQKMDILQLVIYGVYSIGMFWYVFFKGKVSLTTPQSPEYL